MLISAEPTTVSNAPFVRLASPDHRLRDSGFYGELHARTYIRSQLPAYAMRSNLRIPGSGPLASHREVDIVLVGLSGVFALEVKSWRGAVTGRLSDPTWQLVRSYAGGSRVTLQHRNAAQQASTNADALRELLQRAGYDGPVQGIVVFTHPKASLTVEQTEIPVCRLCDLPLVLARYPRCAANRNVALSIVRGLPRLA